LGRLAVRAHGVGVLASFVFPRELAVRLVQDPLGLARDRRLLGGLLADLAQDVAGIPGVVSGILLLSERAFGSSRSVLSRELLIDEGGSIPPRVVSL
jgi:hypothetical protein